MEEINTPSSPILEDKTPRRRLIQTTLFPHRSPVKLEEISNGQQGEEAGGDEEDEYRGAQSNGKRKRKGGGKGKPITRAAKTPNQCQDASSGKIDGQVSLLTNGLQIERTADEDKQVVVNGISPSSGKKTSRRRLIQSTLLPHNSQEDGEEINKVVENEEDEEYCGSQNKNTRKRKGKEKIKCTPTGKTAINCQEASNGQIDSQISLLKNGLQIEKSVDADEQLMNGVSPHSGKKTPRRKLIQSTLMPHNLQEDGAEKNNQVEENDDENYCGSQDKDTRKRKGKEKIIRAPSKKSPICKGALSGKVDSKNPLLTNERQPQKGEGSPEADDKSTRELDSGKVDSKNPLLTNVTETQPQKGEGSPEAEDKSTRELDSGSCKRSTRQSKKGQRASPAKKGQRASPAKKGQRASPHKNLTPSKLKVAHCRRIMADVDMQTDNATEHVFDLRLEAKMAAEENARLFKGRQTHPFFSSWKVGKKIQGTSEATDLESKRRSIMHEGQPIHVFEMLKDDPVLLDWSKWTFFDEQSLDSSSKSETDCSSSYFKGSVNPLKFDDIVIAPELVLTSTTSPSFTFVDHSMSDHQLENLADQERYLAKSLDFELQDELTEERMKLCNPDCTAENSLWTNKYQPRKASEVCGNAESVRFLNEWLGSWHERYSRNLKSSLRDNTHITVDSDYSSEENDSDAESMQEKADDLKNVILISGPIGSGKSAAIYACAREQGFEVIEVSASDWRNGAHIKQKFGAAMQSHGLNKWSAEESSGLRMKHMELPPTQPNKSATQEFSDEIVEVFPGAFKQGSDSFKPDPGSNFVKDKLTSSTRGADKTLILFEDVDTVFEEDRGFIGSVQQIAETAKRPIILTSNRKEPVLPDQLDRFEVCFTVPSHEDLVSHVSKVCDAEQADIHPELLHSFIKCCKGDIRKIIMLLQFWCQGKLSRKDRKGQSTYGTLHFDLDAGHRVIPNVIPWGFSCQLSALVEKEISKSLAVVKENTFLMDILEEEDLDSKETLDASGINMEAKKEVMLSRNNCMDDGNEFPVQFESLEDFSNSSGSQVAFIRQPGRRGLCTVLSSQSEDEIFTENIINDSSVMPGELCNGMFPGISDKSLDLTVSVEDYQQPATDQLQTSEREIPIQNVFDFPHMEAYSNVLSMDLCNEVFPYFPNVSVAQTISVEDYQYPPTGQLHNSEREISIQNLFDCSQMETAQQPCETYKSVDISCVPESSFVAETELDGVEFSNTVSCGHAGIKPETMPLSTDKSVENRSVINTSCLNDTTGLHNISQTNMVNICEVDAASVHIEQTGDSHHEHRESVSRRYQPLDECSRAGFSVASVSYENPCCASQASSVSETWRRLRCCHEDLKSYVTSELRDASQVVKLVSGVTDLISVADLMFGRCQPLINDLLEASKIPSAEPDQFCWYDDHTEMASVMVQHGFCLFANTSVSRGSNPNTKVGMDLASEMLTSTTNTAALGKLLTQNSSTSQNLKNRRTSCDILQKREAEARFYSTIQNVVPSKMYLTLKGSAFHEYLSSLGQISKFEASRLSENFDKTRLRRKGRVARHYLSTGSLGLSPEDATLLAQHSSFGTHA